MTAQTTTTDADQDDGLEALGISDLLRLVPYPLAKPFEPRFWDEVRHAARIVTVELSPRRTAFVQIGGGAALSFQTLPVLRGEILLIAASAGERSRFMEQLAADPTRKWTGSPGLRSDIIAAVREWRSRGR